VLLLQVAMSACIQRRDEAIAKQRTWSHFFEPKWTESVKLDLRKQPDVRPKEIEKIGPWKLLTVPRNAWKDDGDKRNCAESIGFRRDEDRWSIDQSSKLLFSDVRLRTWKEEHMVADGYGGQRRVESRVFGRLSEIEPTSLSAEAKQLFGIHMDSCSFAFAYPLNQFHNPDGTERVDAVSQVETQVPLRLDLELDLHDAIYRMDNEKDFQFDPRCQCCAQERCGDASPTASATCEMCRSKGMLLRFLAVGGYVYFNDKYDVIQLTVLTNVDDGLQFNRPLRSAPLNSASPRQRATTFAEMSRATDERLVGLTVREIGLKLKKRGAFCRPTLPYLRRRGVAGFCWLAPKEFFSGVLVKRELPVQSANPSGLVSRHSKYVVQVAKVDGQIMELDQQIAESEKAHKRQTEFTDRHRDYSEKFAKKHWPHGAFVYQLSDGTTLLFGVKTAEKYTSLGSLNELTSKRHRFKTMARRIQKAWRLRVASIAMIANARILHG